MLLRLCFLVVDHEFAGSISSRKLILETAKFNVITAYSYPEARATLELFPNVNACVVNARSDGRAEALLRHIQQAHPKVKCVITGSRTDLDMKVDLHIETYSPDALLQGLRKLFPADDEQVRQREKQLEESTPPSE